MIEKLNTWASPEFYETYDLGYIQNPNFGNWRLEKDACQFIGKYCETQKPRHVLEFGSGLSTLILAHEAAKGNIEKAWSIDHQKDFPGHPWNDLKAARQNEYILSCHYPIRLRYMAGKLFQFYAIPKTFLKDMGLLDFVIIDGPPYFFEGREAALYLLYDLLNPGSLVIMDDATRKNREQRYVKNWKRYFGENIESVTLLEEFKKGLACIWPTGKQKPLNPLPLRDRLADSRGAFIRSLLGTKFENIYD